MNGNAQRMTSLEIAEVTGKQHIEGEQPPRAVSSKLARGNSPLCHKK